MAPGMETDEGNEWKALLKKWEDSISDLSKVIKEDILEYMDTKMHEGVYNVLLEEELTALDATDLSQAAEDLQSGPITSFFIIANEKNLHPILPVNSTVDALKAQRPTVTPPPQLPPQFTSPPPPPQAPIDLPFTSFCQKPIPLHLQCKELPEERQERLRQERQKRLRQQEQKRPQNRPEKRRQKQLRQHQKRPQNQRKPQPTAKYPR
ncbi:hypothetical protein NA56DRAFT_702435 [Hyaloscypha hepaticicola]|uniref:Uncharacterized protein n=1 Tax=Hyaloscypha hepaticicola TaxID=2082293 RepID=A0A2J6Q8R0_9HELO|nr:hypothetical protein NA56DRAFT_702435 [Hyaloscypha hepaticicola]